MTAEDDPLCEIDPSPDDIDLRLAHADWLEEHDDPRGAMIRIEGQSMSGRSARYIIAIGAYRR